MDRISSTFRGWGGGVKPPQNPYPLGNHNNPYPSAEWTARNQARKLPGAGGTARVGLDPDFLRQKYPSQRETTYRGLPGGTTGDRVALAPDSFRQKYPSQSERAYEGGTPPARRIPVKPLAQWLQEEQKARNGGMNTRFNLQPGQQLGQTPPLPSPVRSGRVKPAVMPPDTTAPLPLRFGGRRRLGGGLRNAMRTQVMNNPQAVLAGA